MNPALQQLLGLAAANKRPAAQDLGLAAKMQRNVRAWLARVQVRRQKKKLARMEFEKARARFRAAQKLQALARGVHCRKGMNAKRIRARKAACDIQRRVRGRAVRIQLWEHVTHQRATYMAAIARGWLVRIRMKTMTAKVIYIQRAYRKWLKRAPESRNMLFEKTQHRKKQAKILQGYFRQYAEKKEVNRIKTAASTSV